VHSDAARQGAVRPDPARHGIVRPDAVGTASPFQTECLLLESGYDLLPYKFLLWCAAGGRALNTAIHYKYRLEIHSHSTTNRKVFQGTRTRDKYATVWTRTEEKDMATL
jgi:hypothetical protein